MVNCMLSKVQLTNNSGSYPCPIAPRAGCDRFGLVDREAFLKRTIMKIQQFLMTFGAVVSGK